MTEGWAVNGKLVNELGKRIDEMYDRYDVEFVDKYGSTREYTGTVVDLISYILPSDTILNVRNTNA